MLDFLVWRSAIDKRQAEKAEIIDRMKYRKMKLRGAVAPVATKLCKERDDLYASDKELIDLQYLLEKLNSEIEYIECTGEFPPDSTEGIKI